MCLPALPHPIRRNLCIVNAVAAVGEAGRGVVLPVLYILIHDVIKAEKEMIGPVVAAFSFGRLGSSFLLGWLGDHPDFGLKKVYLAGIVLNILGALLFILSDELASRDAPWRQDTPLFILFAARAISGMGSGTLSCARDDVRAMTEAPFVAERPAQLALISVSQFAGFAWSPVFVLLLHKDDATPLGYRGFLGMKCGVPAQVGLLLLAMNAVVGLVVLWYYHKGVASPDALPRSHLLPPLTPAQPKQPDLPNPPPLTPAPPKAADPATSPPPLIATSPPPDDDPGPLSPGSARTLKGALRKVGLGVFIALNFTGRGALAMMEALTGRLYLATLPHGLDPDSGERIVLYPDGSVMSMDDQMRRISWFFTALGTLGVLSYLFCSWVTRKGANEVLLLVTGFAAMGVGAAVLALSVETSADGHAVVPGGLSGLVVGAALVWSIGSPVSQFSTLTAFSKVLGRSKAAAKEMGLLGSAGSAGRMLLPTLQILIYRLELQFWITAAVCLLCTVPILTFGVQQTDDAAAREPGSPTATLVGSASPPVVGGYQLATQYADAPPQEPSSRPSRAAPAPSSSLWADERRPLVAGRGPPLNGYAAA